MAIVVEDGSDVSGANSYASEQVVRDYASARGITLPTGDELIAMMLTAMGYLESYRDRYQGERTYGLDQSLQWPRRNVSIDGFAFPSDQIPIELINAECELCIDVFNGIDLFPTQTPSTAVKREKVDVIETEYFTSAEMGGSLFFQPIISDVNALLAPLLNSGSGRLINVRV